jgi:carboxylate-amine ligase
MRLAEHPRKQRASGNVCRLLNGENVWQAARQGTDAVFVDIESGQPQSLSEALSNLIDLIMPEAKALDCASDVQATRSILETGTSADLQLAIHTGALREGASPEEAAEAVARGIAEASLAKSVIAA